MRIRQPPASLYTRIERIRENRAELALLILVTLGIGILANILASYCFSLLQRLDPSKTPEKLVIGVLILLMLVLIAAVVFLLFNRGETRGLRLEIAVPYYLKGTTGFTVLQQNPYRPPYAVVSQARQLFTRVYRENDQSAAELRKKWEQGQASQRLFQNFIHDIQAELVDALLLMAIHRYGEDSLGPAAHYGWWQVDLPGRQIAFTGLPEQLQANRFLGAMNAGSANWNLQFPEAVQLSLSDSGAKRCWRFHHKTYGEIQICCDMHPWIANRPSSQPISVLGDGVRVGKNELIYVTGSRIEAVARFNLTFLPGSDSFMEWAIGLLAYLENSLDWQYYLNSRSDRIGADLAWKIGDLPREGSIWKKLVEIEARLAGLEGQAGASPTAPPEGPPKE